MSNRRKWIRSVSDLQLARFRAWWWLSASQAARRSANFAGTHFFAHFAKHAGILPCRDPAIPEEPLISEVQTLLNNAANRY
jgi:hypothetical protein